MSDYGFTVEEGGLICPKCADNPLYEGELERVEAVGYPDGYTCDDCNTTIDGEGECAYCEAGVAEIHQHEQEGEGE